MTQWTFTCTPQSHTGSGKLPVLPQLSGPGGLIEARRLFCANDLSDQPTTNIYLFTLNFLDF